MRKIVLLFGICGIFLAAGFRAYAKTGESSKESDDIAELKKQISSLDERIKSLEKQLENAKIVVWSPTGDSLEYVIPGFQLRQRLLPKGSVRRDFNGMPFYIVPIKNAK